MVNRRVTTTKPVPTAAHHDGEPRNRDRRGPWRYRHHSLRFFVPYRHGYNLRSREPMRDVMIHLKVSRGLELCPLELCTYEDVHRGTILRICHRIRKVPFC